MKRLLIGVFLAAITLTACVVSPGPPGSGAITVSPLPAVVILGNDPYYYQDGYYYYYHNNYWRYSRSRNGPWSDLPRSHWPKEVRHRDRDRDDHRDRGWDKDRDRDRDDRGDRDRDRERYRDERQDYGR
jgi:hypothetical protein